MPWEAPNRAAPPGLDNSFCRLPRAYALGYPPDAPPALDYEAQDGIDRLDCR